MFILSRMSDELSEYVTSVINFEYTHTNESNVFDDKLTVSHVFSVYNILHNIVTPRAFRSSNIIRIGPYPQVDQIALIFRPIRHDRSHCVTVFSLLLSHFRSFLLSVIRSPDSLDPLVAVAAGAFIPIMPCTDG